jgi:hypothetical protein
MFCLSDYHSLQKAGKLYKRDKSSFIGPPIPPTVNSIAGKQQQQGPSPDFPFSFSGAPKIQEQKKEEKQTVDEVPKPKKPISDRKRKRIMDAWENESKKIGKILQGGELINYYNVIDKKYLLDDHAKSYPAYDDIQIRLPVQCVVIGATGSGKTNLVDNLIGAMKFENVFICAKNLEEPLYAALIDKYTKLGNKLGEQMLWTFDNVKSLPDIMEIKKLVRNKKSVFICDDLVNEPKKDQKRILEYFSQGRKTGDGGLSCFYLSQGYHEIPIFIRKNAKLICLGTLTSQRDLKRIVAEYQLEIPVEKLMEMHREVQKDKTTNFLTIDLTRTKPDELYLKYRKNFATPHRKTN